MAEREVQKRGAPQPSWWLGDPSVWPEITRDNINRMFWLLVVSTSLSILMAITNLLIFQDGTYALAHAFDLIGSAIFFVLLLQARRRRLPEALTRLLSPAYFGFWLLVMDAYYFSALVQEHETITYALGALTPAAIIVLPPHLFLRLLLPNHLLFLSLLTTGFGSLRDQEAILASALNGTLAVLVAGLAAWFVYSAKRTSILHQRIASTRAAETQRSESHLRAILENIPFEAWLRDANGRFLAANEKFATDLHLPLKQILGSTLEDIYPADRAASYRAQDDHVLSTGERFHAELALTTSRGPRWFEVFKSAVLDPSGHPIGTAGLARDVTSRKDIEQALLAADRAKSEFLAMVSHEVRTPLNSILGFADLLENSSLDHEQREFLTSIIQSGKLLLGIINDILDFSKIEAGKLDFREEPFDVAALVNRIAAIFAPLAGRRNVDLITQIPPQLPTLRGDPQRVEQVLINLVSNAVKFTDHGQVTISLEVTPSEEDQCVVAFRVTDSGIGISPAQLEGLFRPFAQADSGMNRHYGGTGLGLVIVQRLCALMGGTVSATSEGPGKGSTFTASLTLPTAAAGQTPEPLSPSQAPTPSLEGLRVLVIEDNELNRRLLSTLLKRMGVTPSVAPGASEGLALLRESSFDVVLMDVQMPGMDGLEATRLIRAEQAAGTLPPTITILALTAMAQPEDEARCRAAGMDGYLTKPIRPDALRSALKGTMSS